MLVVVAMVSYCYLRVHGHGQELEFRADVMFEALLVMQVTIGLLVLASFYIIYFGFPPALTFGATGICKILPSTCVASMPIEGEDGLPCSLKRFREWAGRAVSGEGSWNWDESELRWRHMRCDGAWYLFTFVLTLGIALYAKRRVRRELAQREEKLSGGAHSGEVQDA